MSRLDLAFFRAWRISYDVVLGACSPDPGAPPALRDRARNLSSEFESAWSRRSPIALPERRGEQTGLEDWEISILLPLPRRPAQQGRTTAADHLLDIRVGSRLVEFVVEDRHYVLPRGLENRDTLG